MAEATPKRRPQVFINFRGVELRDNFVTHLVKPLRDAGINVFIETDEKKGIALKNLFKRIKKSTIAIAIFSKRYCESNWCLEELVKMNEQMEKKKLVVIPVFFNVTATEVKSAVNPNKNYKKEVPEGEFTVLFKEMKEKYAKKPEKVQKWEHAIRSVTTKVSFSMILYHGKEMRLVSDIVKEVKKQLKMPIETDLSNGDIASFAFLLNLVFSYIIAPKLLPHWKFLQTGEWVLGVSVVILACYVWTKYNKNKAPPPS